MVDQSRSAVQWLVFLVLSGGSAPAGWVVLEPQYQSPGLRPVEVDPATIRRDGPLVTL